MSACPACARRRVGGACRCCPCTMLASSLHLHCRTCNVIHMLPKPVLPGGMTLKMAEQRANSSSCIASTCKVTCHLREAACASAHVSRGLQERRTLPRCSVTTLHNVVRCITCVLMPSMMDPDRHAPRRCVDNATPTQRRAPIVYDATAFFFSTINTSSPS